MSIENPALSAVLIALALILAETIKLLITWMSKKMKREKSEQTETVEVDLDPEISRAIHEIGHQVREMYSVLSKCDNDGVPMVYSSRTDAQNLKMIVDVMKELSAFQQRLVAISERLDNRFERNDKNDALVFDRVENLLRRIDKTAEENRDNIKDIIRKLPH